jgi:hypothetical protein
LGDAEGKRTAAADDNRFLEMKSEHLWQVVSGKQRRRLNNGSWKWFQHSQVKSSRGKRAVLAADKDF